VTLRAGPRTTTIDQVTDTHAPIVLVHGLWMTPRCWEHWIERYERRGHRVLAPAYPGLEVEVEALRADPTPIADVTIPETLAFLQKVIAELDSPPILIGHSFGGTLVQVLLDRGHGCTGVAIDSVPTEGVRVVPRSQLKASFPVLSNPANRHRAVGFTPEQFHYAFTNTLDEAASRAVYDRYHIPAPGSWVWSGVLANLMPGHQATWVDYHNAHRSPLLLIAGGADNIVPAAVNQANFKRYERSAAHTDYKEFEGRSHYTLGQDGWEDVADHALEWAIEHASLSHAVRA
jgi:pimeloyl-ACP methyl ester carboxylesterase